MNSNSNLNSSMQIKNKQLANASQSKQQLLNLRPSVFYRQRTMPTFNTSKSFIENSNDNLIDKNNSNYSKINNGIQNVTNDSKIPVMSNQKLSFLCPVIFHNKLVFSKLENNTECRCRKQIIPFINDVEYDALLKILPPEQLVVVLITDSR
jgi:hypothetical protein